MRILFVCSGNKPEGIGTIVKNQAISLSVKDIEVDFFLIKGKGVIGYLRNTTKLNKLLKKGNFDIVHAHYTYSAYAASLAEAKPLVVSLMGSDGNGNRLNKFIIRVFSFIFSWKNIIVKSQDMKTKLGLKNCEILPNGVDTTHFKPLDKRASRNILSWDNAKKHILFAANPKRPEKNFKLTNEAFHIIDNELVLLHVLEDVSYEEMPVWMNASDVIVLTSLWEGSPNVIKEAMACNRPIVSTDVGDVRTLMDGVEGCFIAKADQIDVANKIKQAMQFENSVNARQRIIDLGLEINETAGKIIRVYEEVMRKSKAKG